MGTLEEDALFWEKIMPFLAELPRNVQDIWYYAFTEIMNNAIDHSAGEQITFAIQKDALYTEISIADDGIGIFRNIQKYAGEKYGVEINREQAALELYKGRLDEFREIIFDFRGIGFMGQGFADEVFRVFQNMHPDIKLTVINANASVLGMIRHVKREEKPAG